MVNNTFNEEFKNLLTDALKEKGFDVNLSFNEVSKFNQSYTGLVVTPVASNIGCTLNLDTYKEAIENDKCEMSEAIENAVGVVSKGLANTPKIDVSALTNYEQMRDKLVLELVSAKDNEDMLSNVPYKNFLDMAIVYRFVLDSDESGQASIVVTNGLMDAMGITLDQLHADAIENSQKVRPAQISGMTDVMISMMGREKAEMMELPIVPFEEEQMYVVTGPNKMFGAGILVYPDFLKETSVKLGGRNFYVLPSSRHEVILVPDNGELSASCLISMVCEVNATQVEPCDKLTDSVYFYDALSDTFSIAASEEIAEA